MRYDQRREESFLYHLGYRAGLKGGSLVRRRNILRSAFGLPLSKEERQRWPDMGPPGSEQRLTKLTNHLRVLINDLDLQTGRDFSVALSHYRSDLDYLIQTFGTGSLLATSTVTYMSSDWRAMGCARLWETAP